MSTPAVADDVLGRLLDVLQRSTEGRVVVPLEGADRQGFDTLGLDSVGMLNFLVAVEDEFGIEWEDDLPPEVLSSVGSIAAFIRAALGRGAKQ